jgi:prepilin-type processing-associated H-X9-DG protein
MTGGPPNGVFQYAGRLGKGAIGIRDIQDGTSNTIAFGEWRTGDGNSSIITIPTDIVYVGALPAGTAQNNGTLNMPNPILVANFPAWLNQCATALLSSGRTSHTSALGESWAFCLNGVTMGNVLLAPNPKHPNCDSDTAADNGLQYPGMYGLSSYHPGGANVLFCDGSVRFLKDSTNQQTVWALGSRAQGEVISSDQY